MFNAAHYHPEVIEAVKSIPLTGVQQMLRTILHDASMGRTATTIFDHSEVVGIFVPLDSIRQERRVKISMSVFREDLADVLRRVNLSNMVYELSYQRKARALLISSERARRLMTLPAAPEVPPRDDFESDKMTRVNQTVVVAQKELSFSLRRVARHEAVYVFTVNGSETATMIPRNVFDLDLQSTINLTELKNMLGYYCTQCCAGKNYLITLKKAPRVILACLDIIEGLEFRETVSGPQMTEADKLQRSKSRKSTHNTKPPIAVGKPTVIDGRTIAALQDALRMTERIDHPDGVADWVWRLITQYHLGSEYLLASYHRLSDLAILRRHRGLIVPRLPRQISVFRYEITNHEVRAPLPDEVIALFDAGERRQAAQAIDQLIARSRTNS